MEKLRQFLESCKTDKATNVTSLSGAWGGKWLIPPSKYLEFLTLYSAVIANKNIIRLVEKKSDPTELFRFCADIDISEDDYDKYIKDKEYPNFMNTIISIYKETIIFYLETADENTDPIISCRLSNPLKCHLNWPKLVVSNSIASSLREKTIDKLLGAFSSLNIPKNIWVKWIDNNCYTLSGLRLLGSLKRNETDFTDRYHIISSYDEFNHPLNPVHTCKESDILLTSIRVYNSDKLVSLTKEGEDMMKHDKQITIHSDKGGKLSILDKQEPLPEFKQKYIRDVFAKSWTTDYYPKEIIDLFTLGDVKQFGNCFCMSNKIRLPCLIKGAYHKRLTPCHFHCLTADGTTLKCYDEECKGCTYPDIPIPISDEHKKYIFINININNGTITNNYIDTVTSSDTISNSNQLDFVSDYPRISHYKDKDKDIILLKALNGSDTNLAHLLHIITDKKWIYHKNTGWWKWNGVRWKQDGDTGLLRLIHNSIPILINKIREQYAINIKDNLKKVAQIDKLLNKLDAGDFKNKVLKESAWVYSDIDNIDIISKLDTNPYLIGFNNGVYNLESMTFESGKPEDYISQSTNYDYIHKSSYDDEMKNVEQEITSFLESIMPNKDDRHYLLKLLSTGLIGKNPDELFHIFTGVGRNGKSKLIELLNATLGDYITSVSSSFLTSKIGCGEQASPQLMSLKKARIVISSEPDHEGKLNSTIIKQLSGNDQISGRKLYGEQQSFKPYFKIILLCNDIPTINTSEPAIWLRCRCLDFPTKFVDTPKEAHERKIDKEISKKIPGWKAIFFNILIEYFLHWKNENLQMTPNMVERTHEYQGESDLVLAWLTARTEPATTHLHTCEMYNDYIGWYADLNIGKKCISQLEFAKGLKKHVNVKKGVWTNNCSKQGVNSLKLK